MDHGDESYHERKSHSGGTALPTPVGMLWCSAPTNLNRKFVYNGTKVAKFRDAVNSAIELTCNIAFDGAHTPRACFFTGGVNSLVPRTRQGLEF